MLRIGEAAQAFQISRRTLRHWEDTGILQSHRQENGYRFYDGENLNRIRQITLLRRLRMPISEIESMFRTEDPEQAVALLTSHLEHLRGEAAAADALAGLLEQVIRAARGERTPGQVLEALEQAMGSSHMEEPPQIILSERNRVMAGKQDLDVRMVRIPPLTVASYRAFSETPEADCSQVVNAFVLERELHKWSGFRHLGFNNPSPSEGNPAYGYEIWVAVPEDLEIPAPLERKTVDGGLYASISTGMGEIGERWIQLYRWVQDSDAYRWDRDRQWLEECVDFETMCSGPEDRMRLDLLEPVSPR